MIFFLLAPSQRHLTKNWKIVRSTFYGTIRKLSRSISWPFIFICRWQMLEDLYNKSKIAHIFLRYTWLGRTQFSCQKRGRRRKKSDVITKIFVKNKRNRSPTPFISHKYFIRIVIFHQLSKNWEVEAGGLCVPSFNTVWLAHFITAKLHCSLNPSRSFPWINIISFQRDSGAKTDTNVSLTTLQQQKRRQKMFWKGQPIIEVRWTDKRSRQFFVHACHFPTF